jgi:two-component system KDP operon response regulator KdpE
MNLELEGYRVISATDGLDAVRKTREMLPDAVLLDIMMPEMDGYETLKAIREESSVPVIMLTAKSEESDKVKGLDLGADDYVTKPFSPRELVSRVKAVVRRAELPSQVDKAPIVIDDRLSIDFNRREVIVDGKPIKLRPTEWRLLYHLVQNAGWVVPHETLLSKVWGWEYRDETQYLRLYVTYLRQKIEQDPARPRYILTERGTGYRFLDYKKERDREKDK